MQVAYCDPVIKEGAWGDVKKYTIIYWCDLCLLPIDQ